MINFLYLFTPPRNREGVIFSLQFVSVCEWVCLSVCQWTKFQPKGSTELNADFPKWLLTALILTRLVTFGCRLRSQWRKYLIFTPPRNHGGVIFSPQLVCVCVCLCVFGASCSGVSERKARVLKRVWSTKPEGAKRPRMWMQSTKLEGVKRPRMRAQSAKPEGAMRPSRRARMSAANVDASTVLSLKCRSQKGYWLKVVIMTDID